MSTPHTSESLVNPACVAVTALHVIRTRFGTFVLCGVGGYLGVRESSGLWSKTFVTHIFTPQAIHGISSNKCHLDDVSCTSSLLLWGGQKLARCRLQVQHSTNRSDEFEVSISRLWIYDVGDWIMDVKCGGRDADDLLLTAHNAVYQVKSNRDDQPTVQLVCNSLKTLLYSGCLRLIRPNYFLIASGTVFGEIVVWTCSMGQIDGRWMARLCHFFVGHKGSIFGVALSESIDWQGNQRNLLASCSDDRTIRIWDVSDFEDDVVTAAIRLPEDHDTGFGGMHGDSSTLAIAYGHSSRIWGATFLQKWEENDNNLTIVSRGEDGVFQYWMVTKSDLFDKEKHGIATLLPVYHDRHHAGKNIWSWASEFEDNQYNMFTGGADGQIIMRSIRPASSTKVMDTAAIPFCRIFSQIDANKEEYKEFTGKTLKQYLLLAGGTVIAATETGTLLRGSTTAQKPWSIVEEGSPKATITLSSNQSGQLVFVGRSNGSLAMFDGKSSKIIETDCVLPGPMSWMQVAIGSVDTSLPKKILTLVMCFRGKHPSRMIMIKYTGDQVSTTAHILDLPADFVVTASCYDGASDILICGSRSGALAAFDNCNSTNQEQMHAVLLIRHIHGSDAVTSVVRLPSPRNPPGAGAYYLTTGRDGTYAIHQLSQTTDGMSHQLTTVHRSRPPFGPNIEGVYFVGDAQSQINIILYGFRSKDFIVWDETIQKELSSIDCGGAHRSWAYEPSNCEEPTGTFVWTKAGTFNCSQTPDLSCHILQPGGHGREIKAMAISPHLYGQGYQLIATGAEDTDVRLFSYSVNAHGAESVKCIQVLRGHTTGLQHLKFSHCGKYLFSSAGCEEMYVWELHEIPVVGLGAVLVVRLPKEANDSDARIMGFDLRDESTGSVACLAYSNGNVKKFTYAPFEAQFGLVGTYSAELICLTQACCIGDDVIAIGATDGSVRLIDRVQMSCSSTTTIHQNSIAGMVVEALDDKHSLMVTGGDDSALGISLVYLESKPYIRSVIVASAHAAAVTAVTVLRAHWDGVKCGANIASAGNDQKVRIWEFQLQMKQTSEPGTTVGLENASVKKVMEVWTDVADISSIELVQRGISTVNNKPHQRYTIAVAGVGMEIVHVSVET